MLAELVPVQRDKVGGEGDGDVLQRNRAENAPETRLETVPKPRQGKEREEVGAENPDPEEQHGTAGSSRDVNDPKDESDMNELCRSVGEAQIAPVARQSALNAADIAMRSLPQHRRARTGERTISPLPAERSPYPALRRQR